MCDTNPARLKTTLWNAAEASAAAAAAAQTRRSASARPSFVHQPALVLLGRHGDGPDADQREIRVGLVFRGHRARRRDAEPHVVAQRPPRRCAGTPPWPRRTSTAPHVEVRHLAVVHEERRQQQHEGASAARPGPTTSTPQRKAAASCERHQHRHSRIKASWPAHDATLPAGRMPSRSARSNADTGRPARRSAATVLVVPPAAESLCRTSAPNRAAIVGRP